MKEWRRLRENHPACRAAPQDKNALDLLARGVYAGDMLTRRSPLLLGKPSPPCSPIRRRLRGTIRWGAALSVLLVAWTTRAAEPASEPAAPPQAVQYRTGLETIEITADEAPVELAGQEIARVPKGRWFGVRKREGDLIGIHVFSGTNLRIGWVHSRDAKVLKDADVDLPSEAIRIAKIFNPKLDATAVRARLDALADRVAEAAASATTAMAKASRVAAVLYGREGFRYDKDFHTIDLALDHKHGNCLGLSFLYLCATSKLKDTPFRMLSVPRHALVRYDDGRERFNVEPSMMGMLITEDAYLLTHYGKLCDIYPRVLTHPQTVSVLLADAGASLAEQRKEALAIDCFCRSIEINPQHPEGYYNWGVALLMQKKRAGVLGLACKKFSETLQVDPYFAAAYYNWGSALAALGEPKWACEKFAKATELNPRCDEAYFNWGVVLLNQGKRVEAMEKLGRAEAIAPHLQPLIAKILQGQPAPGTIDFSLSPSPP